MKRLLEKTKTTVKDEAGNYSYELEETKFTKKEQGEPFFFMYPLGSKFFTSSKSLAAMKLALYLISNAEINTGRITITGGVRREIMNMCGFGTQTYYNALKEVKNVGVILQKYIVDKKTGEEEIKRGEFMLNPLMFWRGDKTSRKRAAALVVKADKN